VPTISRILMPVAFSAQCRGAVRYAAALARHFHAEVLLLNVVERLIPATASPEAMAYSTASETQPERLEQARLQLEKFFGDELQDTAVTRMVMEGDPPREIVRYSAAERIDLIVMPTHGYGPFRRFLLGSVTAKVLHDAACPVWTGPHLEQAPMPDSIRFERVLCALDLGPHSSAVLAWAADFAREYRARLHILHLLPTTTTYMSGFYFDPEWGELLAKAARDQIARLQDELGTAAEVTVEVGDIPDAVSAAANRLGADLLVIGRGRHAGLLGRLRTSAYAILRESPCPVAAI
jgi:nucleotide-binding universal stress UspA family protein